MFRIRHATAADLAALPAVERSAAEAFRGTGVGLSADAPVSSAEVWRPALRTGTLWVAVDETARIVGFLAARKVNRVLHIDEMDVDFAYQRRGIGRALLHAAIAWSRNAGLTEITLTTFRELAFNRGFYAASGFVELAPDELSPRLKAIRLREASYGLDPEQRCAMALRLQPEQPRG